MKLRRNTKPKSRGGKPYGQWFISLGGGRRENLETQDEQLAKARFRMFQKTGSWRTPIGAAASSPPPADTAPPAPLALLPPPPASSSSSSSSAPPPADESWAADVSGGGGTATKTEENTKAPPPADDDDVIDADVVKQLLETAGAVLVEAQLLAQAWLIKRYKRREPVDVEPDHMLRTIGRKAWAIQFKRWWPNLDIPAWAIALGAAGMCCMIQAQGEEIAPSAARPPQPQHQAPPSEAAAAAA